MAESTAAAVAHLRPNRRVRARFSKVASARDTIRGFTFGQFSLIDLIQAALEIAGPADVTISTWSAGSAFRSIRRPKPKADAGTGWQ